MCKLQEPPFRMDVVVCSNVEDIMALAPKPKEKKTKKPKKTTGMEVVESVQSAPEPQVIVNENTQSAFENVALPTYEEMMFQHCLACGNVEPPLDLPADLEQVALQEKTTAHTLYSSPSRKAINLPCVLWQCGQQADSVEHYMQRDACQNPTAMENLCLSLWIGPYPQAQSNPQKPEESVPMLSEDQGDGVSLFSVDTSATKPNYVPKTATLTALKKRLNDMVQERLQKRPKVEYEETIGRFVFP